MHKETAKLLHVSDNIDLLKGRKINEKIYNGSGSGNYEFTMHSI